jgi:hypothetical protein
VMFDFFLNVVTYPRTSIGMAQVSFLVLCITCPCTARSTHSYSDHLASQARVSKGSPVVI